MLVEKTMRPAIIIAAMAITCLSACSTTGQKSTVAAPPFECTSIHPEVCELEEQFHNLRFELAEQNAAIEEAERRRRAQMQTAGTVAANAVPAS
jgi:hypothetical protein